MSDPRGRDAQAGFVQALARPGAPPPNLPPGHRRRFDIHRNNTVTTMVDALRATFPAVERLVGGEFFAGLARAYLAAEPPRSPLLFRYGAGFGDFIAGFPPAASVPYLADVARLEWLWLQAYHAADARPLGIGALAALPPETLETARIGLHPSLGLIASPHPVVALWAASTDRGPDSAVDLGRGERAAVLRPALGVEVHTLSPGAHALLAALAAGAPLGRAATDAAGQHPDLDLSALLKGLFEIGGVASIGAASDPQNTKGDDG